jgi:hypothetical protein
MPASAPVDRQIRKLECVRGKVGGIVGCRREFRA